MQYDRKRRSPESRHVPAGRSAPSRHCVGSRGVAPSWRGLAFRAKAVGRPAPERRAAGRVANDRVAHDLNNLLAVVLSATEALAMEACEGDRKQIAAAGLEAARRGADLLQQFLADGSENKGAEAPCSSAEVLRSAALLSAQLLPAGVRLAVRGPTDPLYCRADRSELQNALLNLCKNAGEASLGGGLVTLSATSVTEDPISTRRFVRFEVRDDGVGMSPEILGAAQQPYFTTKGDIGGTGLGLHSVAAFAQAAGGTLQIQSEPGRGTCVSLCLPQSSGGGLITGEQL